MEKESNEPPVEPEDAALPPVTSSCHGWTPFARRLFLEVLAETAPSLRTLGTFARVRSSRRCARGLTRWPAGRSP